MRLTASAALGLLLLLPSAPALAWEERNPAEKTRDVVVDVLVARPLGLAQLAVGAVAFIVAGPVDLLWPEDLDAYQVCIGDPLEHTLRRPLAHL